MVGHHNCIVDDNTKRYCDACQRIQMDLQFEQIVKYKSYKYIGNKAYGDYQKIFEFPAYQEDKQ
jgi:hypothetical protein